MGLSKTLILEGIRPLVMNNAEKANPLSERCREYKKASRTKNKTDEQVQELARLEWECGLYFDEQLGPVVPGENVKQCLREGATRFKKGRDFESGVEPADEFVKLVYDGPRDPAVMWTSGKFTDLRMAGNGQGKSKRKVLRCRPIFRKWSLEVSLMIEDVDDDDVLRAAQIAGEKVGICEKHFRWGRFTAKWKD